MKNDSLIANIKLFFIFRLLNSSIKIVNFSIFNYSMCVFTKNITTVLATLVFLPWFSIADAMDFRIYHQRELNQKVVIGEGEIKDGDCNKFLEISKNADRDSEGHITFVLNSMGGSVSAAFELVKAMDQVGVYAIVPDNAICASACASIVYVSAERHMVLGTGHLGFHTCYKLSKDKVDPSAICNEIIAQNAVLRGTSHASVNMFTYDFGPQKMAWLEKKLACQIGLCRP